MTPEQMRRSGHLRIFVSYYRPHLAIFLLDVHQEDNVHHGVICQMYLL